MEIEKHPARALNQVCFLQLGEVMERTKTSKPTIYQQAAKGEFVPPVRLGNRASRWPAHEVDLILAARLAGRTGDEIRALVRKLVEQRQEIFQSLSQNFPEAA